MTADELPPTTVTLTGTGVPLPSPGRAGAGTMVRYGGTVLQFDAGRSTVMRLAEAMVAPSAVTAVFLTHVHADHVGDLADLALTRWIFGPLDPAPPLLVVAPEGATADFARRLFDAYEGDVAARTAELLVGAPAISLRAFAVPRVPTGVWRSEDGSVSVDAVAVHHEPCDDAVAYRVRTPTGVVVISGDTRVCGEIEELADGADIVVHEACRRNELRSALAAQGYDRVLDYHADTLELGAMAERISIPHLVLTHLIPPPVDDSDAEGFAADVRAGGFTGRLTVGHDLLNVTARATARSASRR